MDSHSSAGRRGRLASRARARLSFSNVVAVTALFVALGGSSYAAIRVDSGDIVDGSVKGRDIAKDTIRGTDIRDNDVQGRDIRNRTISGADVKESSLGKVPLAADAETLGGNGPDAFLAKGKLVRVGPVRLNAGEERSFASSGPFTWKATCSDLGAGNMNLVVKLESSEAGAFTGAFGAGGGPVDPGSPATMFDASSVTPGYTIAFPLSASAPSGDAPVGLAFAGLNVGGVDCLVNGLLMP